jgi:hypothetical protein
MSATNVSSLTVELFIIEHSISLSGTLGHYRKSFVRRSQNADYPGNNPLNASVLTRWGFYPQHSLEEISAHNKHPCTEHHTAAADEHDKAWRHHRAAAKNCKEGTPSHIVLVISLIVAFARSVEGYL